MVRMIDKPIEELTRSFSLIYWHEGKAYQVVVKPEQWRLILPYIQFAVGGTVSVLSTPIKGIEKGVIK